MMQWGESSRALGIGISVTAARLAVREAKERKFYCALTFAYLEFV